MILQYNTTYNNTLSQKNDTDVLHYKFTAHQPILVILAEVC